VLVVALTVAALRTPIEPLPGMTVAIRTGLVILCGAMATGAIMIARGMMLVFDGHAAAAYATGGILKPTHAVMMHAGLVLPALAWWLSRAGWSADRQRKYVQLASVGYAALSAIVAAANFTEALR